MPASDESDDQIGSAEVRRLLDVSNMWLQRKLDPTSKQYDPEFPEPVQYSPNGPRHWSRAEIMDYRARKRRVATERRHARRQAAQVQYARTE
jgi:hypothetical protein